MDEGAMGNPAVWDGTSECVRNTRILFSLVLRLMCLHEDGHSPQAKNVGWRQFGNSTGESKG